MMLRVASHNGYGETPDCPDSTYKRGDVVKVRNLKSLAAFPREAIVVAVVPPNFPADWALADLLGERRPAAISRPRRTVSYILVTEDSRKPYLAHDAHLKPSGKPPVEIGSIIREGGEPGPAVRQPKNFLDLDMPNYVPPAGNGTGMFLMPPARGACPTCAHVHPENEPHDPTSLYWGVQRQMIGWPAPTWPEAVAHCAPDLQAAWLTHLRGLGVDIDHGGLRPRQEATHG